MIASLMYDPRCKDVAIYVLVKVLVTCSFEASAFQQHSGEAHSAEKKQGLSNIRKNRSSIRILACDIIQCMLYYVGYTTKHPSWCDSYTTSYCILKSLTSMLRSRRYSSVRGLLQDFFRKGDSIAHVLDVLKNCTRFSSSSSTTGLSPSPRPTTATLDKRNALAVIKLKILRQGLSLLTATMYCNTSCKNEFKYVMSSSPSSAPSPSSSRASVVSPLLGSGVGSSSSSPSNAVMDERARSRSTSGDRGIAGPSSFVSAKFTRYHNFKLMLLQAEPKPSLETFVILAEMLLDGPCMNSRAFVNETEGDAAKAMLGLFANNDERPKIMNYCVIPCIVCLIPHCSQSLQICIINSHILAPRVIHQRSNHMIIASIFRWS